jgi:S1-C subfamily serine protease
MEAVLQQVAGFLYGQPREEPRVAVADIRAALGAIPEADLEQAIRLMEEGVLLRIGLAGNSVQSTAAGKLAFEKACVPEVCLGGAFIAQKYRAAVKHLAVRDREGDDAGGTAFFCADFPGWLATARHLVSDGSELRRIENEDGTVLFNGPFEIRLAGDDLDLALVRCDMPAGVNALRIEWEKDAVRELDSVLVVGYPPIAHHAPALVFSEGQVASLPRKQTGDRYSAIISRITEPGYSGGPVISTNGLVVGVIEQENIFHRKDGSVSIFNGATPPHYFSDFR